ncbi:GNAT family N-acetyltransferase [Candidatus Woesearchaeota archaeon]|nr:GNAT family N-acetyltransferase [Candidatus Woesearchaeota archaeon]
MTTIRKANLADCPACHALCKIEELRTADGDWLPLWYIESFVKEKGIFYVAEEDEEIKGCVIGERTIGNVALLCILAVHHGQRSKGIGTKLMAAFEEECRKREIPYIVLYATKLNQRTQDFYKKLKYNRGLEVVEFNKKL